jgi:hypothetical protein
MFSSIFYQNKYPNSVAMRKIMKDSIDKYIHKVEEKYKYLYPLIKNRYCNNANTTTIGTTISTFLPFFIFGLNFYQSSKGIFNL